jgi:hypothetical protein
LRTVVSPRPRFGRVDDALEGEIVGRLADQAEIGHGVADLEPLVEARAADDAVVEAERDETVFELAHLEGGAHEDRHVVAQLVLPRCSSRSPRRRRGLPPRNPRPRDRRPSRRPGPAVGEQRLAEPALVVGDQVAGGTEDMGGGAVVALQLDHLGAGKILLEAQDVVDLRAAPAIDRLVVVADAADVLRHALRALGEQAQPHVLSRVGVLVLVDEDVAELVVIVLQDIRMVAEHADRVQQQVAEVAGVQRLQPVLVGGVEFAALAIGEGAGVALRDLRRSGPCSSSCRSCRRTAGPASACRRCPRLDQLLDQPDLVVGVEDGEVGTQAASSAWRRSSFTPIEWKVPSQGMPSAAPPTRTPMRSFISRAALLVKVTARIWDG